jgi:uncharacterized membrane protein
MAFSHILLGAGTKPTHPVVRRISAFDLMQALTRGYNDFSAMPSHAVFLCVIYPLLGLLLIATTLGYSVPLAFPLAAGFALIGPLAATGLYELSRRREAGLDCSAGHVLDVLHSPSLAAIVLLGILLMTIFLIWLQSRRQFTSPISAMAPRRQFLSSLTSCSIPQPDGTSSSWASV